MHIEFDGYLISDDKTLLSVEVISGFLGRSYWAAGRPLEVIEASIRNSLCYGLYHEGRQIGFARAVTDLATMYWLADVFMDEAYRGTGLGKKLVAAVINSEELRGLTGRLGTKDAHELYKQFGFVMDEGRAMAKRPGGV
ncbi:MAG: N-acetyltransferase [Paenibacillaceae bacterium]|jgi:GNAT superfamily N-acetyltransferase|nr:N-acetyltransferase [Paenibacillaceae bacterium]